jgi:site-specific DNA-methyltransferase (adenine-specific)
MGYTLYQGDCLDILPTIESGSIDAVIADTPYMLGASSARRSANKVMGWADINNAAYWYRAWMLEAWRTLSDDGACWVFANWKTLPVLQCAASGIAGMYLTSVVVWDREWPGVGSTRGLRQYYELICLFAKPDFAILDRTIGDIWRCKWATQRLTGHPQEKPVELIRRILQLSGKNILDPFMGSGTTGVACQMEGRSFVGIELDAGYYDIAKRRIEQVPLEMIYVE